MGIHNINALTDADEPRLTESEWRARETMRTCLEQGHTWVTISNGNGIPTSMFCERACGIGAYDITPKES